MSELSTIEIDFDVHRKIENERRGFDEPPLNALRRLLGIDPKESLERAGLGPHPSAPWRGQGVQLPSGTLFRASYNGREFSGRIENGRWIVGEKSYSSPSGAAIDNFLTKSGRKTNLNGWRQWEVKRPSDKNWVALESLRLDQILKNLG